MKHPRLILLIIFTLIFGVSALAQRKFGGTVIDVVDGKTVVLEMQAGKKITVELQYIDVPEPEQQLHQTVREHLQQMVYGKQVEFVARGFTETKTIGQLLVGGVDVSQQMLRDGAAWHVLPEVSGQDEVGTKIYTDTEKQAKEEKRGVWGIEGLKPAWEFRAEKQKTPEVEISKENNEENKEINQSKRTPSIGLNQFDLTQSKVEKEESVYKIPNSEKEAIKKSFEAVEMMRLFLKDLMTVGIRLSDYKGRLAELRFEVEGASKGLPKGKLRILMNENVDILDDLGIIFKEMRENDFLYYRNFQSLSKKYLIEPVRNNAGDFVLWRKDIISAMADKAFNNFSELQRTLKEQEKYTK
ncbi:MAG TPA: thermonuclease family protein [Pyrinomonadaceae bacterium]|jgi:endonuclease YncB( thermonuclease family)